MRDEAATRHPNREPDDCGSDDCGSGKRNRFFRGKQMRAEEFKIEQRHMVERRRLVNRAVLGWGVVYGFKLKLRDTHPPRLTQTNTAEQTAAPVARKKLKIGRGFALDRHGRETVLDHRMTLDASNTFLLSEVGCEPRSIAGAKPGRYVLAIHYAERAVEDTKLPWGCGCGKPEKKYICETVVFSLRPVGDHGCPCPELHCHRHCKCPDRCDACGAAGRGPHACLCQWLKNADIAGETSPSHGWHGVCVDPHAGVDLACITLGENDDACEPITVTAIDDDCGPRKLVKGNDLLYDLARGCDLTKISYISWEPWHRKLGRDQEIPWEKFASFLSGEGFVFQFSGPVQTDTIDRDTVVITVYSFEQPTGWRIARRIPIDRIDTEQKPKDKPDDELPDSLTDQIKVIVRKRWLDDEVSGDTDSWFTDRTFRVEVELRGFTVLDCHWQALDAVTTGRKAVPSGVGVPGGVFLSSFRVGPKPRLEDPHDPDGAE